MQVATHRHRAAFALGIAESDMNLFSLENTTSVQLKTHMTTHFTVVQNCLSDPAQQNTGNLWRARVEYYARTRPGSTGIETNSYGWSDLQDVFTLEPNIDPPSHMLACLSRYNPT